MADLLIKGMEIPKRCTGCFHSKCLLFFEHTDPDNSRHPNCPLIELPPHGRLIDADNLKDAIVRCINDAEKEYPKEDFGLVKMVYESCLYHISNAPTVLEAST